MADRSEFVVVELSGAALARLDEMVAAEGTTRPEAASRVLDAALTPASLRRQRQQALALLDTEEDLAGP